MFGRLHLTNALLGSESGGHMTLPINQTEKSTRSLVKLTTSDIQFAESGPATTRPFEHAFCGVLVGLIYAIITILLVVALMTISSYR